MAVSLANVWPYASHIYIGLAGASTTDGTDWVDVGAYKAGSGKFVGEENTYETQIGKHGISKMLGFECDALETTDAKVTSFETFEGALCDILLVPVNGSSNARLKLKNVIPRLAMTGGFDGKDPAGIKFRAEGVYNKVSDFMVRATLAWRL